MTTTDTGAGPRNPSLEAKGAGLPTPPNFPVTWQEPDAGRLFWTHFSMHLPRPVTPMTYSFSFHRGFNQGAQRYGLPLRAAVQRINTYFYWAVFPAVPPEEMEARGRLAEAALRDAALELRGRWETGWLPEVERHLAFWDGFDREAATMPALLSHLDETYERMQRVWAIHFELILPMYLAVSLFDECYQDAFPKAVPGTAYLLLQGFGNKTVETDRALWRLSRAAGASPSVREVILEDRKSVV